MEPESPILPTFSVVRHLFYSCFVDLFSLSLRIYRFHLRVIIILRWAIPFSIFHVEITVNLSLFWAHLPPPLPPTLQDDATLQDELPPMGDVGEPQRSTSPVMFGRRKPKILFNSNDNDDGFFPKENVSNSQELLRPRFSSFARHNSSNSLLPDNLPPRQRSSCKR